MLVCCSEIENKMMPADDAVSPMQGDRYPTGYIRRTDAAASGHDLAAEKLLHPDAMGVLVPGRDKHFYSSGAFNLIQLIFYILKQTGPAHLLLTTYSISMDSIAAIHRKVETGELLSVRFLIDNRVRSISPKPFDYLVTTFPDCYRCLALHAKVALLYNEDWKITVVGSQNATHNPKLERGIIHTGRDIFDFDFKMLNLTQEQREEIEKMAYRLIPPGLIAINIGADETDFLAELRTPGTEIRTAFYRGHLRQTVELRESLIKSAVNGSNPAQQELIKFIKSQQQYLEYE